MLLFLFIASFVSLLDPSLLSQNREFWTAHLKNSSPDIRITSVQKLMELSASSTISAIGELLKDPEAEVRYYAAQALGNLFMPESLLILQSAIQKETDPYLRSEMKRSVKKIDVALKKKVEEEERALKNQEEFSGPDIDSLKKQD